MILIKAFRDNTRTKPKEKSRAIIACEKCHNEHEVRYDYYSECVRKDRKYCKSCQSKLKLELSRIELNKSNPLSICTVVNYNSDNKPMGTFSCTACNRTRDLPYRPKSYNQLCNSCSVKEFAQANKQHEIRHDHRLSRILNNMRERTQNPNSTRYVDYGERGITICPEWASGSKVAFYDWALANGYEEHLTIDRKDNNKGYEPDNCKWSTLQEQQANTRIQKNNNTGYRGVNTADNGKFRARISIANKEKQIGTFDTPEEANEALQEYKRNL